MSGTVTLEPVVTREQADELERWLNHEVEKPCEILIRPSPWADGGDACGKPADWHARMHCPKKDCRDASFFICTKCKGVAEAGGTGCSNHPWQRVEITYVERIR